MLFDLALPKNWYYFDDKESKQHYYAQPCSGKVKWSMPEKCVPCEQHPLRFAIFYCQDCGIMLCDECNTGNLSMKKTIHLEHNKLNAVRYGTSNESFILVLKKSSVLVALFCSRILFMKNRTIPFRFSFC